MVVLFTMLTGVTKFGKVSVFSDLNNLNEGSSIIVCSIDGKQVKSLKATAGDCHFNMAEGLYIVNVDGKSFKVIVR